MIFIYAILPTFVWLVVGPFVPNMTLAVYVIGAVFIGDAAAVVGSLLHAMRC